MKKLEIVAIKILIAMTISELFWRESLYFDELAQYVIWVTVMMSVGYDLMRVAVKDIITPVIMWGMKKRREKQERNEKKKIEREIFINKVSDPEFHKLLKELKEYIDK